MLNHFNFKRLADNTFLVTNDFGHHAFLSREDFKRLVTNTPFDDSNMEASLKEKLFIVEERDLYSHETSGLLREMRCHIFSATSLHIFVVTNACNLRCVYCQAQSHTRNDATSRLMSKDTARKAVDIALQSPACHLTFEFQGGEPLINFDTIKEIVEYSKSIAPDRNISYSLVTNLSLMDNEKASYLMENNVSISTSLDGPNHVHDLNRPSRTGRSSYKMMMDGMSLVHGRGYPVGTIQTTTRQSLSHAREIVCEHVRLGSNGIFIRPLTPLGLAKDAWSSIGYEPDEYLAFYQEAFDEILRINRAGIIFPEQYAAIILRKILFQQDTNYMDLCSPCGAGIGQLAYYYNGDVYTCDEGRMIGESDDAAFRLGNVYTHSYRDLISCDTCVATVSSSVTETLPACCDCVYQPFCGVCPVVSYGTHHDIFPHDARSWRCQVFAGIMNFLFELIRLDDPETMSILRSWIGTRGR